MKKTKKLISILLTMMVVWTLVPAMSAYAANLSVTNLSAKVNGTSVTLTATTTTGSSDTNGWFDPTWEISFDDGYDAGTNSGSRKYISNGKTFSDTFSNRPYGYFGARCTTKNDWGEKSPYSSKVYFTITPPAPTSLSVSNVTQTSATLSWRFQVIVCKGMMLKSETVAEV